MDVIMEDVPSGPGQSMLLLLSTVSPSVQHPLTRWRLRGWCPVIWRLILPGILPSSMWNWGFEAGTSNDGFWAVMLYTIANGACPSGTERKRLRQINRMRES